jgi:two-component system CheB/CheR fusion protein
MTTPNLAPHYIIAIGASAGGLEEINAFFDHTPMDNVSYVIIQHLSSDFKSQLVELLARHSKLEVFEVENGMSVLNNKVYIIPHNKFMYIRDGHLYLTEKAEIKAPHLTINYFFNSLAADCGKKAIAVVLSGMGTDGTEGVKAISNAGGMVIARDPKASSFSSMPSHAIATGMVDFISEPEKMPDIIKDYVKQENELQANIKEDEKYAKAIVKLIKEQSPLDFSEYKQTTILRRIKRRSVSNNFNRLQDYLAFLKITPDEVEALSKDFLISVTSFFRDKNAYESLEKNVIPHIINNLNPSDEIRIWITGCATGEEAYSMAILIAEQLPNKIKNTSVKIFATDIDTIALNFAGKGIYTKNIEKDVSENRLKTFFTEEGDCYKVNAEIRKMVIFAQHDLVKNPPYCNMHFISCRNLLIYMTPALQKKIYLMLLFGLKMNGYLFLGSSENPVSILHNLKVIDKKWKIYENKENKRFVRFDAFTLPLVQPDKKITAAPYSFEDLPNTFDKNLAEMVNQTIIQELDCLVVCVDEQNQVIKHYGDTSKYLLQKNFNLNLPELLPRPLAVAFNTLNIKALKADKKFTTKEIKIKHNNEVINVTLSVSPLITNRSDKKLMLVTFSEDVSTVQNPSQELIFDQNLYQDEYTLNLEDELKHLKEKLNTAYLQLDASNENMQSFNEELLSANEEMQSTNEEMQSVNEELHTVNADHQNKNKELLELNDDLNNYFRSNINGQLFVNEELILMKYSPGTVKQINLLPSDIGRPLSNISTNIKFETITDDIKEVIKNGSVITKEIQTDNGKWYQIMTMPYLQQQDNQIKGGIITFNDITDLKKAQYELDLSSKLLVMAIESASMGVWSINLETAEFITSPRFKEIFGCNAGHSVTFDQTIESIDIEYKELIKNTIQESIANKQGCDMEYPINILSNSKPKWIRLIGNISSNKENIPVYFTGVLTDITIHKEDEIRKSDFIAMVSHELKSPLTTLQAYIQLLSSTTAIKDEIFIATAWIKANMQVKKMIALINGFLNVSSFEAGKIYLNEERFDFSNFIKEIIEDFTLINPTPKIVLHNNCKISLTADREKIGQVITNFLSNALKYSPIYKDIYIDCKQVENCLQVSIKDSGIGILLKDQEKLFERYSRIENTNQQAVPGFGLGLYLSAEIIHRHNGKVWVESELGKGSTFFFSLPVKGIAQKPVEEKLI